MFARRVLDGGPAVLVSERLESEGFLAAFTERTGGVSQDRYRSLNLGFGTGDDRARVLENRRRAGASVGVSRFACARQVHGARVARVDESRSDAGFEDPSTAFREADALIVSRPGLSLAVLTADCVPIALARPRTGTLAVVHAGWRGLAAGVVPAAVEAVGEPGEILAAIGPSVGPDHYEVGWDLVDAVGRGTDGRASVLEAESQPRLDLGATAEAVLAGMGVRSIDRVEVCTACRPDRFFSYRRDGATGRQGLIAVRMG